MGLDCRAVDGFGNSALPVLYVGFSSCGGSILGRLSFVFSRLCLLGRVWDAGAHMGVSLLRLSRWRCAGFSFLDGLASAIDAEKRDAGRFFLRDAGRGGSGVSGYLMCCFGMLWFWCLVL